MTGQDRIRAVGLVLLAAVGIVVLTGCAGRDTGPLSHTTSPSVSPTSKATLPGPNNFSPAPITPLTPTVNPDGQGAQRP